MKRIISCIAAAALLLTVLCFAALASDKNVYEALFEGMRNTDESIDLEKYSITAATLHETMELVMHNEPMLFHAVGSYSYGYDTYSGEITHVMPDYSMSKSEYASACDYVEAELEKIIESIPSGLGDAEKALYLHDYLIVNLEYDLDYEIYDIYNTLKNGECVCMGYALLYDELLSRIGIESYAVLSPYDSLNHMWNEIEIDGKWYHVDLTWDDPINDVFGRAIHENFLTCDSCAKTNHDNCVYYTKNECNSKTYEAVGWRDISSPIAFVGGKLYALSGASIVTLELTSDSLTTVDTLFTKGWESSDNYYLGYRSGFGGYGDYLYYNTTDSIMRYDVSSGESEAVYTPDSSLGQIVGLYMKGNEIHYLESPTGYYEDGVEYTYTVTEQPSNDNSSAHDESKPDESNPDESTPDESNPVERVGGDANGDGVLDEYDYIYVKRVYFGTLIIGDSARERSDVNNDGAVDQYDYILVRRAYFGTYVFE